MLWAGTGLIAFLFAAPASHPPSPPCRDAADCNVAGTRALRSGQLAAAEDDFEAEVRFAWCAGDTPGVVLAHDNLAVLALRREEPLEARFWAGIALELDPAGAAARYNARVADERAARLPPPQGVTGTYKSGSGDSLLNEVWILEVAGDTLRFEAWASGAFSCVDMGSHLGGAWAAWRWSVAMRYGRRRSSAAAAGFTSRSRPTS